MTIERVETFIENDIIVDGVKVGTVELCPERNEISRLVIFEPYQNKGYGTMIIKDLIQQGYSSLWVRSDNKKRFTFMKNVDLQKVKHRCLK